MTDREIILELHTHTISILSALQIAKSYALVIPPDINDKNYWQHEIDAFLKIQKAVSETVKATDEAERNGA